LRHFLLVHNRNLFNISYLILFLIGTNLALYKGRSKFKRKGWKAMIDRSEVSRALAKAIAFKNCGKDREAEDWAR